MSGLVADKSSKIRVLVTRPLPDALATAEKLHNAQFIPVLLPLTETVPTHVLLPTGTFDAIAVTSANALRHANIAQVTSYRNLPLYAVGEKTANVARETGFTHIHAGDGWGLHLGKHVAATLPTGSRVLYLAGKVRRPDFEAQLVAAGIMPVVAETYDTLPVDYENKQLAAILQAGAAELILLYSAVSAQQLSALDKQVNGAFLKNAKQILCLSQRIAAELPERCQTLVKVSDTPDEDALFRLLAHV